MMHFIAAHLFNFYILPLKFTSMLFHRTQFNRTSQPCKNPVCSKATILRIFHALTPPLSNNALKLCIFGLDTHCEVPRYRILYEENDLATKSQPEGHVSIAWNERLHTRRDCLQGTELSFCNAFAAEAQIMLKVSVIASTQLDAVSPLSKYLVQMYNLLVVK